MLNLDVGANIRDLAKMVAVIEDLVRKESALQAADVEGNNRNLV